MLFTRLFPVISTACYPPLSRWHQVPYGHPDQPNIDSIPHIGSSQPCMRRGICMSSPQKPHWLTRLSLGGIFLTRQPGGSRLPHWKLGGGGLARDRRLVFTWHPTHVSENLPGLLPGLPALMKPLLRARLREGCCHPLTRTVFVRGVCDLWHLGR